MKRQLFLIVFILCNCSIEVIAQNPTLAWAKGMGGINNDQGSSIAVDGVGNVYTTGYFSATTDFDPGSGTFTLTPGGGSDVFISKLDPVGNFVWAKQIGGPSPLDHGYGITLDALGNIYTTGCFGGTADFDPGLGTFTLATGSNFNSDIFISKLDPNGNFMWAKQFGGSYGDKGFSIAIDAFANIYTTGSFGSTVDFDPGPGTFTLTSMGGSDIFVSKLDAGGNFIWAEQLGGTGASDFGYGIAIDVSANVYTTGTFGGTADFDPGPGTCIFTGYNNDIFISKLNAAGNFVWAKQLAGKGGETAYGISVDASSNVYSTGYFQDTVDFDPNIGTFTLAANAEDMFISKLDAAGNFLWAKQSGGSLSQQGNGIAVDASSNVYTTGFFADTTDFDPGVGTFTLVSASGSAFVSTLDAAGNFIWAGQLGGNGLSISLDASNNIYTTGYFDGTADFDPNAGVFNLSSVGLSDIFVHKMSQAPLNIKEAIFINNCKIYPNPFNNKITIASQDIKQTVQIFNTLGVALYNGKIENEKTEIDLSDFAAGIYFIKIGSETKKVIKE
ncbi:MAG TPA: SBBP repeat-containing protein [Bacteroidia bacterium]|jgi:hypothetical protein|nr:SBBP repeat-containing protein [Bacteroidia bacterium]